MYGIKGFIFFGNQKFPFENPPFEAITGYDKGHQFMKETINSIESALKDGPKATGYMFILTKEVK